MLAIFAAWCAADPQEVVDMLSSPILRRIIPPAKLHIPRLNRQLTLFGRIAHLTTALEAKSRQTSRAINLRKSESLIVVRRSVISIREALTWTLLCRQSGTPLLWDGESKCQDQCSTCTIVSQDG